MRQRHAARGGLFQELAFLEPICSRDSTPPSITRPAAKSASSRAGADSSSGITRRSSAFARERKPMPAPSVHASMLSRVPAGTRAMSHQKHETPASAVQIGSGALKQMAETEAIRQASIIQALRQCSKSICSIPQKACAGNLYCLPSFIILQSVPDPPEAWPCQSHEVRPDA